MLTYKRDISDNESAMDGWVCMCVGDHNKFRNTENKKEKEHLIISSKTDREAGREVRERKIVVEKRSVDEMILVYLCVCVCRVCV